VRRGGAVARRRLDSLAAASTHPKTIRRAETAPGLDETLTLQALGIGGRLYQKLRTTNAIENLNSGIVTYSKNVKRWQGGSMVVRWTSAAIVEAEKKFRRVQGWRDIEKLVRALDILEAGQPEQNAKGERVA